MSGKVIVSNAADEGQVKEASVKVKKGRNQEIQDIAFILNDKRGRRFFWRYLSTCGVFKSSADNSGSWTYFNEGRRNVGLQLLSDMDEAAPEAYSLMLKESKEET